MDILLLKKIKSLGEIGEKVSVKSGYARNYLIPNKHAVLPTKANLAVVEEKKQELIKQEEELKSLAIIQQDKFKDYVLSFEVNVQEDADNLFGSITLQNILDRLIEDGYEVTKKQVSLPSGAIKNFAEDYIATVSLYADISVTIPIKLIRNNVKAPEPLIDGDTTAELSTDETKS
ncbi:MAG: 50S ribosomal protein L9 [Gammaproteobacteria bacterium]|nr:50S ribosomal protein L9 [Gammaproteobacteria bacterium]MBT4654324.1 50S ribosomal protein L9 [Gammaproteobacteria bacterium]MBT5116893.1 50S ribosomal protein L9 [Gammaproteobacteria bacterium]MBT5761229.1 50S ribosomal protein L9 [Gammaproteobacteria bacterium]MBT6332063.1 50S ribosomal protein L9 [Gammaproteobacteria bacterium]